ncbi:hypothetical protein KGQ20_13695 [Catenulispora sp. NF23]|uniref:hypothetical protein n=1 Tax=Catenulispora pinistramenti TaxID=2705254 RepID=UPI001BA85263|nr:hypothetical protein [Catenulispora pinistramenti]MBS2533821.1 hypothetical protein [Catenulispora pinistramenti]
MASALALALLAQSTPAPVHAATTTAGPAAAAALPAPGSVADRNLTGWLQEVQADPNRFDQFLEEDCIKDGGAVCTLSAQQVHDIPGEIKSLTQALDQEVEDDPQLVTAANGPDASAPGGPQPRAFSGSLVKVMRNVAKASKNVFVRKVGASSETVDEIADIAGKVSQGVVALDGTKSLAEGSVVKFGKAAVSLIPGVGDVFSLVDSAINGDAEGIVVATVSLIATAVAIKCPPAGAVIAVGLALWSLGKMIWGWFAGGSQDWQPTPPPTPEELIEQGASLQWTTERIDDKDVALVLPKDGNKASLTLLVDSKWTEHNQNSKPLDYTIRPLENTFHWTEGGMSLPALWRPTLEYSGYPDSFTLWQAGTTYQGTCRNSDLLVSHAPWSRQQYNCGLGTGIRIGLNKPAVITVTYGYYLDCRGFLLACEEPPSTGDVSTALTVAGKHKNGEDYNAYLPTKVNYAIVP